MPIGIDCSRWLDGQGLNFGLISRSVSAQRITAIASMRSSGERQIQTAWGQEETLLTYLLSRPSDCTMLPLCPRISHPNIRAHLGSGHD